MNSKFIRTVAATLTTMMTFSTIPASTVATVIEAENKVPLLMVYDAAPTYDSLDAYKTWEDYGLAMGNGGIGGSVFGGVQRERINLNEKSLWSGGPSQSRPDYNGGNIADKGQNGKIFRQVQQLFNEGKIDEAIALCDVYLVGTKTGYGYYLNYGDMNFEFDYADAEYSNYQKTLDLRTGVITVEYDVNGVHYVRETFTSYPDNVIVTNIKTTGGKLGFNLAIAPDNEVGSDTVSGNKNTDYTRTWTTTVEDATISINGTLDDNGLQFASHSKVISDGTVTENTADLSVSGATEATVITSIATDYKNVYPAYRTEESMTEVSDRVLGYVTRATARGYDSLKERHIADYDEIFSRVDFVLTNEVPEMTTEALIDAYNDGSATLAEKNYLEMLMFQFGRYVSIEGSRETPKDDPSRLTLPTNLQGMWVGANNSAWHSDYHFNINLQMNYWPAYVTNMAETAEPLVDYIEGIRIPGRITAAIYAGIESTQENPENGFMVHTQNTPYGYTCPGYTFSWGWSTSAVAWILQNCWEHYEYTGDIDYMREKIYPMLKETSIFYDQYLTEDKDGYLVSSPAYSPEHGPYTAGNTYEHALIWQLYEDTITAAELLGVDKELTEKWKSNQSRLKGPIEIGDDGQIKEWYEETTFGSTDGFQARHRHLSNLIGLFPGDYISTETPELFEAAKVSLEERGDASTGWASSSGWSITWRALCWARLGDGERAYDLLDYAVGDTLPNLYSSYPPFQIDGVYGYSAAVAEMLIQSNAGYINLLPAISDEWADGSVKGLVARGNFEVDMKWSDKKLTAASVHSNLGGKAVVGYDNIAFAKVTDSKGNEIKVTPVSLDRISFETEKGESYTITEIPSDEKAPENLIAERIGSAGVELSWDAVSLKDATYNVYRQVGFGETQLIADGITDTKYTDTNVSELLDNIKYRVCAVSDGIETELSDEVTLTVYADAGMIDDSDPRVIYTAGTNGKNFNKENYPEGHQYYQPLLYDITCHNISGSNTAGQKAELTFVGTGIEVIVVKYSNRGNMDVQIDGKDYGKCNTYLNSSSVVYGESGFSVTDLEYGKHTITLTVPEGEKTVQIDAFRVLDSGKEMPSSVEIKTPVDTTVISKLGGTMQLSAIVGPENAADKSVKWTSLDESILTVSPDGLVTSKSVNGKATIKAQSNMDANVYDTIEISVLVQEFEEIIIDESIEMPAAVATAMNKTGSATYGKNCAIVWSSTGWQNPYAGEPTKHYGTRKTSGFSTSGAQFEYTFTGTGIQIIAQKTKNMGGYQITLDGKDMGAYSLYTSASAGEAQSVIFESLNLDFGVHTIIGKAVELDGRTEVNLDAIRVYMPKNRIVSNYTSTKIDTSPSSALNTDIKFDSSWWVYTESGHYGGSKAEQRNEGATVEYTFTGDGIRVLANIQKFQAGYDVYIDGNLCGSASMYSVDNVKQAVIFEKTGLGETEHTIKLVTKIVEGRTEWNIDAFEVVNLSDTPNYTYEKPYEYYEESITNADGYTGSVNPAFILTGSWGGNVAYWKEPFQHHGYRKRDASAGATVEFTFTGTGVQLGAQKNTAYAGYQVWIDGVDYGTYSLKDTVRKDQSIVFSKLDLPQGAHTFKATAVALNGSSSANLDYICVYNYDSAPEICDKSELYNLIMSTKDLNEDYYAKDKWSVFETALKNAITVSENGVANQEQIENAKEQLLTAIDGLGAPTVTAPDTAGLSAQVIHLEGKRAIISWDACDNANYYIVRLGENEKTVYDTCFDTMATLLPDTDYTIEIYPVTAYEDIASVSKSPVSISFKTKDTIPPVLPDFEIEDVSNPAIISWNECEDAEKYVLYLNGEKFETTDASYNFGQLTSGGAYKLIVIAVDENGNESVPLLKTFTVDDAAIDRVSLTLKNDLTFNMKVLSEYKDKQPSVTVEVKGKKQTIDTFTEDESGYLVFSYENIIPSLMKEEIKATFSYEKNGNKVTGAQQIFTIADYCYALIEQNADDEKLVTLVKDALNYGAAAQQYTNYKTEDLANRKLDEADKTIREVGDIANRISVSDVIEEKAVWKTHGLNLDKAIAIRLSFTLKNAKDVSVVVKDENGETVEIITEFVKSPYGKYSFCFDGLYASQVGDVFSFTVMEGETAVSETLDYSVESYVSCVTEQDAQYDIARAIVAYGRSAADYLA